jgi:hypothetical protein
MEGTGDIKEELPPVDEDAEDVDMVMGTLSIDNTYIANTPLQMDHVINPKLFVYHLLLSL